MKRIFLINDVDTVITNKSMKETIEWYEKDYDEVESMEEVRMTAMNKGFWSENVPKELKDIFYEINSSASDISISKLEIVRDNDVIKLGIFKGELCMWKTFKEEFDNYNSSEPNIICSSEY